MANAVVSSTSLPFPELFYSKEASANYLGISVATLDRLIKKSAIQSYKIGKSRRFKKEDLENYLETSKSK